MAAQKLQGASWEKQTHPWCSLASAGTPTPPSQEEPRRNKPLQRFGFVRQYLISPSLNPRHPPGGLRGPRLYAAHAGGRETDSSREAPVNHGPFHCVTSA